MTTKFWSKTNVGKRNEMVYHFVLRGLLSWNDDVIIGFLRIRKIDSLRI